MMPVFEKDRFREALIERMDLTGISAAELSRRTGVSKSQIDKLRQRKSEVTNVYDAILIARFFGQPVEEFMGIAKKGAKHQEILDLLASLSPDVKDMLVIQIKALAAVRTQA